MVRQATLSEKKTETADLGKANTQKSFKAGLKGIQPPSLLKLKSAKNAPVKAALKALKTPKDLPKGLPPL
jgi:hypothetical protein